jgi:hypothetical protein
LWLTISSVSMRLQALLERAFFPQFRMQSVTF